ncbi:hypothetical protein Glove_58g74 [Diversispora epigaea]|uniref:TLDc domain-containing protein n=1 Tax=Diversispora epigaea TaxID=1348612 RepID=A0A397JN55_9GLOM|nr:hypothetical protein Glove_58g74 [Diversispora epigaea]
MVNTNELEFKELSRKLQSYLIETKASWLRTHFSIISHHFKKQHWLKRDDLKVEEIKIWDYVIKWGIAQNPSLPTNLEEWSNENFKALKITLQQCLLLIRYFHISSEDIWEKVKPYKKILEEQLWDDIIQHSMSPNKPITSLVLPARIISNSKLPSRTIPTPELPSRVNERFSTIINKEHVAELSSWIDKKSTTYSLENIPYEFQLILHGSRDGFDPKTFWNMCNGHAGTIVVAKVAGTDEIVGGYNPLAWDNLIRGREMKTNDSFIFSLQNGNIQNSILSQVINSSYALFYPSSQNIFGPWFGEGEFSMESSVSDFSKDEKCRCSRGNSYEKRIRKTFQDFSLADYEVFKIIKNKF